ncbi:SWD1 [Candida pseudojiufengensis]|uniref:SWD1 n=1 Tax=Candida pseudojiufengensis TaxID=497109 RepID=UPI002225A92C|nr:SWD1 [Candida pseudojiufengensis]KAI5959065.1 SWD1 [Candida pseudojiufengensis]
MNLQLQDPFSVAKEFPENLSTTLNYGHSVAIQFNHKGDYLASGLSDGSIVIYDMVSNGLIAHITEQCHVRPITSITWSTCGRYLLTSSQDWYCKLWDLSKINKNNDDSPVIRQVKFDGPIWSANIHPENHFVFIASLLDDSPVYVDLKDEKPIVKKLRTNPLENGNEEQDGVETPLKKRRKKDNTSKQSTLVTAFTEQGKYIFTGTSKGWLNIFRTNDLKLIHSVKLANSNIKNISISPNQRKLAVNFSDRIIRQIDLPDLMNDDNDTTEWDFDIDHKYQDVVNRLQWNSITFNHNAEFLIASTHGQSSHDLYLWETSMGSLIKILEGSNEELIDVKWNYNRCKIGSIGLDSGSIYIWSIQFPQKWSALAPDFVEVEENIEYIEKEDEFDILDESEVNKKRMEEEDLDIDVITKETTDARGFDITKESFIIPINYV